MEKLAKLIWGWMTFVLHFVLVRVLRIGFFEKNWDSFLQLVKFGIVGVSNSVVYYLIYVLVLLGLQALGVLAKYDYLFAQFLGFVISVLWAYYWNRRYVFKPQEEISFVRSLAKTYLTYAFTGLFLNSILAMLWIQVLQIPKLVAPMISLLINIPINFLLNKYWAFRKAGV